MLYRSGHAAACSATSALLVPYATLAFLPPTSSSIEQLSLCCNCQEHWKEIEFELSWKSQGEEAPTLGADTKEWPAKSLKTF